MNYYDTRRHTFDVIGLKGGKCIAKSTVMISFQYGLGWCSVRLKNE